MRTPSGLPSASRMQLAVTCPASQALPVVDSEIEAGHEGTELHDLLMRAVLGEEQRGSGEQLTWLDAVLETVGDRLQGAAVEVAYGWDAATGEARLYGSRIGRHYPERPASMLVGTADYVLTGGETALVVDLKTGLTEQPPVKRLQQMRFLALAVATWDGFSKPVQTAILHAPRDGRRPWWEWGPKYDSLDLVEVIDTFRSMMSRIIHARADVKAGKTPRLTVGSHCTYCPAYRSCPAQQSMLRNTDGSLVGSDGEVWAMLDAIEARVKQERSRLYARAAVEPFALPDGRVVGKHRKQGRSEVDVERLWPWLVERIGVDGAREAVTMKASKTSVRDAVGAHAARGQKKAAGDAAVRELEASGVIADKWTEEVGVYEPTEDLSAQPALASTTAQPPGAAALALVNPGDAAQETNQ